MLVCFRLIPRMRPILCVTRVAVLVQTYIILWSYPRFYARTIEGIVNDTAMNSRPRLWQSFAGGVRKLSYTALTKGALCLG